MVFSLVVIMWNRENGEGYSQIPMNDINSTPATQPGTPMNPPPRKPAVVVASSSAPRRTELHQPLLAADSPMGAQPQHAYYPILPNNQSYAAPNAPPPAAEWNYQALSGGAPPPPPSPTVNSGGPAASQNNAWSCLACTFENPAMDSQCRICSTDRGASAPAQPQQAAPRQAVQAAAPVPVPAAAYQQQPVAYRSAPQGAPVPPAPPAGAGRSPSGGRGQGSGGGLRSSNAEVRPYRDWYCASCLTMLCCFIPAFPCAVAAMMNSVRARSAAFYGDAPSARRFSKKAKKLIIFCIVFGIIARIVFFHVIHRPHVHRCHGRWAFGSWHHGCDDHRHGDHGHGHGDHMNGGDGMGGGDWSWTVTTWTEVGEGGDRVDPDFTWPPMGGDPLMNPDDPMINGGDLNGAGGDHGENGWWWRPHGGRHGRHHGNGAGGEGHQGDEHQQRGHHRGGRHGHGGGDDGGHHGEVEHHPEDGEGSAGGAVRGHQPGDPGDDKPEPQPLPRGPEKITAPEGYKGNVKIMQEGGSPFSPEELQRMLNGGVQGPIRRHFDVDDMIIGGEREVIVRDEQEVIVRAP